VPPKFIDTLFADSCEVALSRTRGRVAVDGEVVPFEAPLQYRLLRDAIPVVVGHRPTDMPARS
jgi:hypothetical protein